MVFGQMTHVTENNFSVRMILAQLWFESSELQSCSTCEMARICIVHLVNNHVPRLPQSSSAAAALRLTETNSFGRLRISLYSLCTLELTTDILHLLFKTISEICLLSLALREGQRLDQEGKVLFCFKVFSFYLEIINIFTWAERNCIL